MSEPRVDVHVGPRKKHYSILKNLLCHYADYFKTCFNRSFIDVRTQKLTLNEDPVQDLEILLGHMLSGCLVPYDAIQLAETEKAGLKESMKFIKYTVKYGMGRASFGISDLLQRILPTTNTWDPNKGYWLDAHIEPSDVEAVFRISSPDSPLRRLIAKAALSTAGRERNIFSKQGREGKGFATEMLALMRPT
jgi:hypothetical protein